MFREPSISAQNMDRRKERPMTIKPYSEGIVGASEMRMEKTARKRTGREREMKRTGRENKTFEMTRNKKKQAIYGDRERTN